MKITFSYCAEEEELNFNKILEQIQRDMIHWALCNNKNTKAYAARALQMNRTTLVEKMKKLGMNVDDYVRGRKCELQGTQSEGLRSELGSTEKPESDWQASP